MEESYVQDVRAVNRFGYRMNIRGGRSHRSSNRTCCWCGRKAATLDAVPRRLRGGRRERFAIATTGWKNCFFSQSKSTASQAEKIVSESARYNIGDIERTINLPLLGDDGARSSDAAKLSVSSARTDRGLLPSCRQSPAFVDCPGCGDRVDSNETQVRTMIATPRGRTCERRAVSGSLCPMLKC